MWLMDRLSSLVTGLGTGKDKTSSIAFGLRSIGQQELSAMHRSDWLARKVVDIIPQDMTREWRDWQSKGDDIELIEKVEADLNLAAKVTEALQMARLYGGAAIYMGIKGDDPSQELKLDSIKLGDLEYIHVLSRHEITAGEIDRDVVSPFYGQPLAYRMSGTKGETTIHPSRIVRLIGAPVLDRQIMTGTDGWGDSVLQIVYDAIQNAASAQQHIAALIPEAKADVIYIPKLSQWLQDPAQTQKLTERFTYANTIKSMFNMVLLEGNGGSGDQAQGEKWEQKQISFAQMPELMQQYLKIAAGAADITLMRLLQDAPSGLGNNGENALQAYYDNIAARQRTELTPAMARLDEVIIRSATGKRDPSTWYTWAPLWGLSDKDKADIFKTKVDAVKALADGNIIPIEALSDATVNMISEDGSMPGLEAAIEEHGKLSEQEPDEEDVQAAAGAEVIPLRRAANDAEPQTLYVRRDVLNRADIVRWAEGQGFTDIVPDLHVTIAYSTTKVDWFKVGQSWSDKLNIAAGGPRQMERLGPTGKYIALLITASELVWRNKEIREAGASWDWPDYQPHISIQIGGDIDLSKVEPYRGKIVLGPELFEEVRED